MAPHVNFFIALTH